MQIIKEILRKNNLKFSKIEKASQGFTNQVYLTENYVVKIAPKDDSESLLKEIKIYQNIKKHYMPTYISSGEYNGFLYLIISRLKGINLFHIWHGLSEDERRNIIKQISCILCDFNNTNADFLDRKFKLYRFKNYIKNELLKRCLKAESLGLDTSILKIFLNKNMFGWFDKNEYSLVYNDAHFDNFLYDGEKIMLIDFDRTIYAPIDYELLILKTMIDNPQKFANEEDEDLAYFEDYQKIYGWFKEFYPSIFKNKYVEERVKLYQFNYLLKQSLHRKDGTTSKKLSKKLLIDFENFIKSIKIK